MNVVLAEDGSFIEVQGTAEGATFSEAELFKMIELAKKGGGADITSEASPFGELTRCCHLIKRFHQSCNIR